MGFEGGCSRKKRLSGDKLGQEEAKPAGKRKIINTQKIAPENAGEVAISEDRKYFWLKPWAAAEWKEGGGLGGKKV